MKFVEMLVNYSMISIGFLSKAVRFKGNAYFIHINSRQWKRERKGAWKERPLVYAQGCKYVWTWQVWKSKFSYAHLKKKILDRWYVLWRLRWLSRACTQRHKICISVTVLIKWPTVCVWYSGECPFQVEQRPGIVLQLWKRTKESKKQSLTVSHF